jgi:CubicO group peptidase (beta-lactamase class C family)
MIFRSLAKLFLFANVTMTCIGQGKPEDFHAVMTRHQDFSGVVLAAKQGRPVFYKAYGKRSFNSGERVRRTDIFELASVSKTFTSCVIMMLAQEGRLGYDDPVERYLQIPYPGITIRHLLTHTNGLPDYQEIMDRHWDKSKVAGNADILAYLNRYAPPRLFAPGERYEYSNTGYVLLASIAEKASGTDFAGFVRDRIFRTSGMKDADIRTPAEKKSLENLAKGHILVKERGRYVPADSFPSSNYTIWLGNRKGPGRVSATAMDLLKWDRSLASTLLLNDKTKAEAFRPATLNDGRKSDYGFGWFLSKTDRGEDILWHDGDNPGYKTAIRRHPASDRTLIILSNNYYSDFEALKEGLEKILLGR